MTQERDLGPIRVVVVDDADDIRLILRLQFGRDPRFLVVGEGADGNEAIALAEAEHPDLIVLDRQMPRLGGVEAIPEIRRRAPGTAIVLYTANADLATSQAAVGAGALGVLEKGAPGRGFVERLVESLMEHAATADETMAISVGPVSGAAARVWIANTRTILGAVAAHPEVLSEPIPGEVIDLFGSFLDEWDAVAAQAEEFRWVARARPVDVSRIVGHWAAIDAMTDDQLASLGIHWSPPEGEPFFEALTAGVLAAMQRNEETRKLAARVDAQWSAYLKR